MKIYADVFLFQNLIVNVMTLYIVNCLLGMKKDVKRMALAASVGAGYALYVLLARNAILTHFITKILVLSIMLLITNCFNGFKSFVKQLACYLTVTVLFGGLILVLKEQFLHVDQPIYYHSFALNSFSFKYYLIILFLLVVYKFIIVKYIYAYRLAQNTSVLVKAMIGKLQINFPTILDTGNRLVDPMSQKPIIVVSLSELKLQLPEEMYGALVMLSEKLEVTEQVNVNCQSLYHRCKWVPYKSLGTQYKMLLAMRPDDISYIYQSKEYHGIEALLGLAPEDYFGGKSFKGLMHPAIFQHLS